LSTYAKNWLDLILISDQYMQATLRFVIWWLSINFSLDYL